MKELRRLARGHSKVPRVERLQRLAVKHDRRRSSVPLTAQTPRRREEVEYPSTMRLRLRPLIRSCKWIILKLFTCRAHCTPRDVGAFGFGFTVMPTLSVSFAVPTILLASLLLSDSTSS